MTIGVGALLLRGHEVLLGRRSAHKSYPGCWDVPGGHVEAGETVEQALARELGEELGVTPLQWRLLSSFRFREGDSWSDALIYGIDAWLGDPILANDEHSELRWFGLAEVCDLEGLAAADYRPILRRLRDAL